MKNDLFESLIDAYWCLAYKEGEEGRSHDTENGDAQRILSGITSYVKTLRDQRRSSQQDISRMADEIESLRAQLEAQSTPPAANWAPSNKDYDRSIHSNPCHQAWARFFMETFPNCGADEDTMAGWFANAMMAKYDSPAAKVPEGLSEISDSENQECYAKGWNACREAMLAAQEGEK